MLPVVLLLAGGCSSDLWDVLFPRDLCAEIQPILPSPRDTADTLRQVAAQAALIGEVCAQ
jgi:hypothetical protein